MRLRLHRRLPRRWLLTPPLLLWVFAAVYIFIFVAELYFHRTFGHLYVEILQPKLHRLMAIDVVAFCILAGWIRAISYHPHFSATYRAWLITSPWNPRLPLPLGPITLAWQDLLIVAVATAIARWTSADVSIALPAVFFLVGFLVPTLFVLTKTKQIWAAIAIAFGIGGVIQLYRSPTLLLVSVATLYLIAHVALHRSLCDFPWITWPPKQRQPKLGWPLDRLGPQSPSEVLGKLEFVTIAALIGWWAFAAFHLSLQIDPVHGADDSLFIVILIAVCAAAMRLMLYKAQYSSPISLMGRLFTGQIIIPRHDQVFIAPLCTIGVCLLAIAVLHDSGLGVATKTGVEVGVTFMTVFSVGPSLSAWQLTGAHRILVSRVVDPRKSPR